ncbi:OLC1v1004331C1 [Oldenlandia corymbosa var. corymbosa]|uniref:OLC1v1004331C1 n=1 Tax=Oldenlandia corymbosa var. corymbosa TaxID=529605 RepID=A0AAV1DC37_OLDCO|nr:OLC1v1004331C1 [Oldenlandia corymbosa var. corymbosa]
MDTRPYRLNWPRSTLIFDISPEKVFTAASLKLKEVGAKTGRSCLFIHIPSESSDIEVIMRKKGFKGTRPSFWVLQGLPLLNLVSFKEILNVVSNLAIKGCLLLGELPSWLSETEVSSKSTQNQWIDNLFMSHGFQVNMIQYDQVARDFRKELKEDGNRNILFVAEQLRYSDDQVKHPTSSIMILYCQNTVVLFSFFLASFFMIMNFLPISRYHYAYVEFLIKEDKIYACFSTKHDGNCVELHDC